MHIKFSSWEFTIRGQVGILSGIAHLVTREPGAWDITGISLYVHALGAPPRRLDPGEERKRLESAVYLQDGDRISHMVAALYGHDLARAS